MTDDSANAVVVLLIGAVLYFLPTVIALGRGRTNTAAIFALNLLLGWTLLGWVLAIVWSLAADSPRSDGAGGGPAVDKRSTVLVEPSEEKTCPRCAETIKAAATVCRYCGHEFEPVEGAS